MTARKSSPTHSDGCMEREGWGSRRCSATDVIREAIPQKRKEISRVTEVCQIAKGRDLCIISAKPFIADGTRLITPPMKDNQRATGGMLRKDLGSHICSLPFVRLLFCLFYRSASLLSS
jgi:hypothetical protein